MDSARRIKCGPADRRWVLSKNGRRGRQFARFGQVSRRGQMRHAALEGYSCFNSLWDKVFDSQNQADYLPWPGKLGQFDIAEVASSDDT